MLYLATLRIAATKLLIILREMVAAAGAPCERKVVVVVVVAGEGVPKVYPTRGRRSMAATGFIAQVSGPQ